MAKTNENDAQLAENLPPGSDEAQARRLGSVMDPRRGYQGNESLILVGFVGAGKRTLGLIASAALQRELINYDVLFQQQTGIQPGDYIDTYGPERYQVLEHEITTDVIERKRTGAVLVGFFKVLRGRGSMTLRELCKTNPVVLIRRDIDKHPDFLRDEEKFTRAHRVSNILYGRCSNFDFFNITQPDGEGIRAPLKLKQTERYFKRFLNAIFGQSSRLLHSADPLSLSYTHALQVPLSWLENIKSDLSVLECGADAVNLILDGDVENPNTVAHRVSKQISFLRQHTRLPVIFDIGTSENPNTTYYEDLLEIGFRQASDMVIVSLDCTARADALTAAKGHAKMIGVWHTPTAWSRVWESTTWRVMYKKAKILSCDAIRITSASGSVLNNLECLRIIHAANKSLEIPIIGYNTDAQGQTSVCFNPILSPIVLPSMLHNGVTLQQAHQALYSSYFLPKKHFTIVGKTVTYSLSPHMHNAAYSACGMPHVYDSMQVDSFSSVQRLFEEGDRDGLVVSLPYKTDILQILDEVAPDARCIGAVNTVVVEKDLVSGQPSKGPILKGYNTDYIGIMNCIQLNLSPANSVKQGTSALIVGAGGMARAAIYACVQVGIQNICIFNRTRENAHKLAEYYNHLSTSGWKESLSLSVLETLDSPWPAQLRQPTVIVSCIAPDTPATFSIPEQWLCSKTGGVFIEVRVSLNLLDSVLTLHTASIHPPRYAVYKADAVKGLARMDPSRWF